MLDEKELRIVKALRENSRISIRALAKKTGLRPSTVHLKIKKLKKEGVIERITVKLDNKAVEENFIVFLLIKTKKDIKSSVFNDSHIKEVFGVTGEYDMLIKLKFGSIDEFNDFIIKFRKEQEPEATLSLVATINLKEEI